MICPSLLHEHVKARRITAPFMWSNDPDAVNDGADAGIVRRDCEAASRD
jgi:hypothetical protein